jgi:ActR/RegA family two-component response regulator
MTTVLICEDDPLLAADLVMSVEEIGHRVTGVCTSAESALKAAEIELPDVAFIDLELADGLTGGSLAHALQSRGVKVIVLSGHPNVGAGLGTVPHTYAAKPMSPDMVEFLLCPAPRTNTAKNGFAGPPAASA